MNTNNTFSSNVIWTAIICVALFFGLWYILSLFGLTDVAEQAQSHIVLSGIVAAIISIVLFSIRLRYLLKNK